jgi:hypothetical protein
MKSFDPRQCRCAQVLVIALCLLVAGQSVGQQAPSPSSSSKFKEASDYLTQADKALQCDPVKAEALANKALGVLSEARESDRVLMTDAVGDLKSQCNFKINAAQKRRAELDASANEAKEELKHGHPQSASARLKKADPDGCYEGYRDLIAQVDQNRAKADALVAQGDHVQRKHPGRAFDLYKQAQSLDADVPDLSAKIVSAQAAAQHKARVARNRVIALIVVLGAVGVCLWAVTTYSNSQNSYTGN